MYIMIGSSKFSVLITADIMELTDILIIKLPVLISNVIGLMRIENLTP